jgi:putative endonuclease
MNTKSWFLYIVETEEGLLYTGITKDLERRFQEHQGTKKGAKFFRRSKPERIHFSMKRLAHGDALRLESAVKKLKRQQKLELTILDARRILKRLKTEKEK